MIVTQSGVYTYLEWYGSMALVMAPLVLMVISTLVRTNRVSNERLGLDWDSGLDGLGRWVDPRGIEHPIAEIPPERTDCIDDCPGCAARSMLIILHELGDSDELASEMSRTLAQNARRNHVQT